MAIDTNGAQAWPTAWQDIGAVPYQLIITMPQYTWVAVAQLAGFFLVVAALVVMISGKKIGYGRGAFAGLVVAFVVSLPMFLAIDFGPKKFEPIGQLVERLEPLPMSEPVMAALCKAKAFPSEFEAECEKRDPLQRCYNVGYRMSSCIPPINKPE